MTAALHDLASTGRVEVRVTPGASRDAVRIVDGVVQVRVTAPPADGAANEAVLSLLAVAFKLPRRNLTLLRGGAARIKLVAVALD